MIFLFPLEFWYLHLLLVYYSITSFNLVEPCHMVKHFGYVHVYTSIKTLFSKEASSKTLRPRFLYFLSLSSMDRCGPSGEMKIRGKEATRAKKRGRRLRIKAFIDMLSLLVLFYRMALLSISSSFRRTWTFGFYSFQVSQHAISDRLVVITGFSITWFTWSTRFRPSSYFKQFFGRVGNKMCVNLTLLRACMYSIGVK